MTAIDFAQALNPEQLAAVTHGDGPQLVLAGAGSGKTRVITYRIAWLVRERGVAPGRIAAVTFTNKAAREMEERLESLLAVCPLDSFVGTFHRFALRLLRAYGERVKLPRDFSILDTSDQQNLIKKAIKAEGLPENFQPQAVMGAISHAKNRLLGPAEYERQANDFFSRRVAPVYRRYQALIREAGGVDFDDMILLAVRLLRGDEELRRRIRRRFGYLLVDEFQDTNHAQISLILEINDVGGNLTAVGDEDQSIYRWRGAELNNILHFERTFPGAVVRKLERNYRSTQTILDASGALIANNVDRRGKTLWTDAGAGEKLTFYRAVDEQDEARWVVDTLKGLEHAFPLGAMAVLVRTNAQTRSFEEEFLRQRMPYALVGGLRFYERAEIKDLIAYLRLLRNPYDLFSFNRILNRPARGIGKATHQLLLARATQRGRAVWDVLVADDLDGIPLRGARALGRFRDLMRSLIDEAKDLPFPELLDRLLEATSYTDLYDKSDDDSRARLENIGELRTAVREFTETYPAASGDEDLLTAFLDHASLVSADDVAVGQSVSLMTLHSAKGLEFSVVVVAGLEEDLLPHFNAATLTEEIEEERRLLYVGMTRAKERLLLTTSRRRRVAGTYQDRDESRFLAEIPGRFLEPEESLQLSRRREGSGEGVHNIYSFFGRERRSAGDGAGEGSENGEEPWDRPAREEPPRRDGGLRRGSRVRHAKLGTGKVLSIEGSGEEMRVNVYFDSVGRRKLIVRYANLEIV